MASIYQRGKTWWITYYNDGTHFQHSLKTRDKKVAAYLKNKLEADLAEGKSPLPETKQTAKEILKEYLIHCESRLAPYTVKYYRYYLEKFVDQQKINRIKQINERTVFNWIDTYLRDGKKQTADHCLRYVKAFLSFCVRRNYSAHNPLQNTKSIKLDKKAPRFLTKEEIATLLSISKETTIYPIILTAIYTGMRLGELMRLQWPDIDLNNRTITVKKSKSGRFRSIPIHDTLLSEIVEICPRKDPVLNFKNFKSIFPDIRSKSGIKNFTFHDLRHTFASHLVMNGVDVVTVSKLLGHANIKTTMIYSHLSDGHVRDSINKLLLQ